MSKTNNQKYKKLFQTVCEAPINAPKEVFNLHDWVFTLSDKDYQTTARGHIAAGSSIHTDGTQTSINVESVGGNLLVSKYNLENYDFSKIQVSGKIRRYNDKVHNLNPT